MSKSASADDAPYKDEILVEGAIPDEAAQQWPVHDRRSGGGGVT
jgi:hypothetical protein